MDVIFCSSIFDMSQYEKIRKKSKAPLGLADHNLNQNIIIGIEENIGESVKLVNNVQIPNYPKYPKIIFHRQEWKHTTEADDVNCGFINLPVIKHFSRAYATYSELKRRIKNIGEDKVYLITYDLHFGISLAVSRIVKKYPNLKTCLIMPDFPVAVLMASSQGNIKFKDRIMARLKAGFISVYKSYVVLTEQMTDVIDGINKQYVVMEGIFNSHLPELPPKTNPKKVILYTGQLNPVYGLDNLIDAFIEIAKKYTDYELWLCGSGPMVSRIKELMREYPQIRYLGYCNTDEVRKYQSQATILINPRQNTGEYTKYSFPSKTMEYLASGRPMIGYKLDGIPDEYDDYICYVEDNSVGALKDKIVEICSLTDSERQSIGQRGREFILQEKNPHKQCVAIVRMLKRL
ncbi:MAG: glycosyltransferase [Lachnospiraceae bacterium]|nr:glycosyltransferase [Lachnospiraceae bacterium]